MIHRRSFYNANEDSINKSVASHITKNKIEENQTNLNQGLNDEKILGKRPFFLKNSRKLSKRLGKGDWLGVKLSKRLGKRTELDDFLRGRLVDSLRFPRLKNTRIRNERRNFHERHPLETSMHDLEDTKRCEDVTDEECNKDESGMVSEDDFHQNSARSKRMNEMNSAGFNGDTWNSKFR